MVFSSMAFIYLFLPVILFLYYIIFRWNRFLQNMILLFSSLVFYAWGEPKFVLVMIGSILVNWFFGLLVDSWKNKMFLKKIALAVDIAFNLGILFYYKYLCFTGKVLNQILNLNLQVKDIVLPIGISFFTFQALSYVVDVYRQKAEVQENPFYVGLYISFFPQLIAGPIVRYETIAEQIENRKDSLNGIFDGFARFVVGLSKKVLLANSMAIVADQVFNANSNGQVISVAFSWLGAVAYTFQIYYDFSGYSDMAIGLGRMFGFQFLENFNYPYVSTSITDFWRRWHISLGTWFRDYVYIPLGGSRCTKARNILNLLTVWILTGLWHGANVTFIVWGLMYFVLLVIEKTTGLHEIVPNSFFTVTLRRIFTLFFVVIGWVVFRSDTLGHAFNYFCCMLGLKRNPFTDGLFLGWGSQNALLLCVGVVLSTPALKPIWEARKSEFLRTVLLIFLFIFSIARLVSSSYNPFIYFNF